MAQLQYDVFLSYCQKDHEHVHLLAGKLRDGGLRVYTYQWATRPGDITSADARKSLDQSRALILVISKNAIRTKWGLTETPILKFSDPASSERRFIPLRLDDAPIPKVLKQFHYVDWRLESSNELQKLLDVCRPDSKTIDDEVQKKPTTTHRVISRATGPIYAIALAEDSSRAVCCSGNDELVRVWDLKTGKNISSHAVSGHGVAIVPDGTKIVLGASDWTIRAWEVDTKERVAILKNHVGPVYAVAVTSDGNRIVSGSYDSTVRVWKVDTGDQVSVLRGHNSAVNGISVTSNGTRAVSGSADGSVRVWDLEAGDCIRVLNGHLSGVESVAATPDGTLCISGSSDTTVGVWDLETGQHIAVLEGHTGSVRGVALSADGKRALSGSDDGTVRLWNLKTGTCISVLEGHTASVLTVAMDSEGRMAVSGSADGTARQWELPAFDDVETPRIEAKYTNAKVLIVGDTGVGKTGLAIRLTKDRFEATISTDGAWAIQLRLPEENITTDTDREIWLWDFAGQSDYRLIHQLFMDETSLTVIVFNPQSENPFEVPSQWVRDLQRSARRPFRQLLVAGRCDRGGLPEVNRGSVEEYRVTHRFAEYLETSARTGVGCAELREAIIRNIHWNDIPYTSSPRIFKLLKEEILKLKDEGKVLLRLAELKQQLEMRLPSERFEVKELRAVVGLLVGPGVVWQLEFGDFVLLQPERINAYAAALIRKVRAHTEEIGVISEENVLRGNLDFQDMRRLFPEEEQIVLRAMHQTFVDRGLCFRESTEAGTLLVFPSYFKRERPEMGGHPAVFVTYRFNGQLDEIYSTLVIRLHNTPVFEKDQLWRFAADFKSQSGKRVGLKMIKHAEGEGEISIYFERGVPDDTKVNFIRYVHEHIKLKAQDVRRFRYYVCPHCNIPVKDRETAAERRESGKKDIVCVRCEKRVPLWDLIEEKFASPEYERRVSQWGEEAQIKIDNESKELILVGHAFVTAASAGHIFRPTPNSDWGIDGEIEFKNNKGEASGKRVYLQLKSGDSYLKTRKRDGKEMFTITNSRHVEYWQSHAYPVMLVIRSSDGRIRWMNVTDYLKQNYTKEQLEVDGKDSSSMDVEFDRKDLPSMSAEVDGKDLSSMDIDFEVEDFLSMGVAFEVKDSTPINIEFDGEDFTPLSVANLRDRILELNRERVEIPD